MGELAAAVSAVTGRDIGYADLPPVELASALAGAGVPDPMVEFLVDADQGIARGELDTDLSGLQGLVGHPLVTLDEAVAAALTDS